MGRERLEVWGEAEAGPIGGEHMAVRDFQLLFEDLAVHRIDRARVVFEYQPVWNRRHQVDVDLLLAVRRDW